MHYNKMYNNCELLYFRNNELISRKGGYILGEALESND